MTAPPVKPATIKARNGADDVGEVTVERDGEFVNVTWVTSCARRTFTPKELRDVLSQLDIIAALGGEDVWLESTDHNGAYFAVLVKGGRIYGADGIGDPERINNTTWTTTKKALIARARQGAAQQE